MFLLFALGQDGIFSFRHFDIKFSKLSSSSYNLYRINNCTVCCKCGELTPHQPNLSAVRHTHGYSLQYAGSSGCLVRPFFFINFSPPTRRACLPGRPSDGRPGALSLTDNQFTQARACFLPAFFHQFDLYSPNVPGDCISACYHPEGCAVYFSINVNQPGDRSIRIC